MWEPEGEAEVAMNVHGLHGVPLLELSGGGPVPLWEPSPLSPRTMGVVAEAWMTVYQAETVALWRWVFCPSVPGQSDVP